VNVLEDGGSVAMVEGETYAVSPENAKTLASLGYVEISTERAAKPLKPTVGDTGDEHSIGGPEIAPKVPRH
jgi:hypothetical protein